MRYDRLWPVSDRRVQPSRPAGQALGLRLLSNLQRVVDLDREGI
jgi:hypothetical protein